MTILAQVEEQTMAAPTSEANQHFEDAIGHFQVLWQTSAGFMREKDSAIAFTLAKGLESMTQGLQSLSVGLRATYVLLDEVNRTIKRSKPESKWG